MLSGSLPFGSVANDSLEVVFERISEAVFDFDKTEFEAVSSAAKDLISKMLVVDPEERFTAEQCLRHPWLASVAAGSPALGRVPNAASPLPARPVAPRAASTDERI
eukprot:m51a1_g12486 putative ribosomal protein s6 kinase alpha-6-like (106) ;mRNA; f:5-322